MTRRSGILAPFLAAAAACSGGAAGPPPPHPVGAESFRSPAPGTPASLASGFPGAPGPAGPGTTTATPTDGAGTTRAIEEADVYKLVGTTLYVLNAFRGLQVVDLADLASPRLVGRFPVEGTPVDLYVRDRTAFVVVSDSFAYVAADGGGLRPWRGSRLLAVDVSDPAAPVPIADLPVDGQVETTRIVGDVLYVVSRNFWWYDWIGPVATGGGIVGVATAPVPVGPAGSFAPAPGSDTVFVASFDVSIPSAPRPVDRLELSATGWDTHANVTAERATLSFSGWEADGTGSWGPVTHFQAVDIADPGGRLRAGASFSAAGQVRDRWGMDFDGASGLFRAVLAPGWLGGALLELWSSPSPDAAEPLARLAIDVPESLTAARFDGARVYVVTARLIDPLFVVDTSDPAMPKLGGKVVMSGQLDFIEPRGQRLVALGHTNEAGQPFQLAVSLFDVADLAAPALLSRVTFGPSWSWLGAQPDDLRKAFLVFDPPPAGIGLVLVPLQGWDAGSYAWVGGTQLVDWPGDALVLRGFLGHPGRVTRAFPTEASGARLAALSDQALQTIDASDRDAPRELARLDLARPVFGLAILGAAAVELAGDWWSGAVELAVTGALDPDAPVPLARVPVAAPSARMFPDGNVVWLLARDWAAGKAWLQAVDLADPVHPLMRGRLDLAPEDAGGAVPIWWGWGDEAVRVGHALALHRTVWRLPGPLCPGCPAGGEAADRVLVIDLADADQPRIAADVEIADSVWSWGLTASGTFLWLTHYEWDGLASEGRYFVDRIDLADPAHPVLLAKINVPGIFFGASEDGLRIATLETWWRDDGPLTWVHGLEITAEGKARLYGSAAIPGYPEGTATGPDFAWIAAGAWDGQAWTARLWAVNLGTMAASGGEAVRGDWAWLVKAAGGKLFLQAGWRDQGILVYDLADPALPAFERFVRTSGWVWDVVVANGWAYLPSGPYGVPMVRLEP